jgi:FkbM family methyltransferase
MLSTSSNTKTHVVTQVRGLSLKLVSYTRALELCARMNYETEVLDFIDDIDEGQVLYDLGACEGRFAVYAAKRRVHCYAFEPEAANFQALLENVALNGNSVGQYIHPMNYAVGSYTGAARMRVGQPWAGGHQKTVVHEAERTDLNFDAVAEQDIQVVALDDYFNSLRIPAPNYLKVDVDGSELALLEGASQMLAEPGLRGIIIELCTADKSYGMVVSKLNDAGFAAGAHCQVPNEPNLFNVVFSKR